jgi:ATP-dependent DNA helicase Rep
VTSTSSPRAANGAAVRGAQGGAASAHRAAARPVPAAVPATLNAAQMAAVHHLSGPCLVLAGAGSGKTRVITHKIARLLEAGYAPSQIAAITFTNKAAQEMRERARALVGAKAAAELAVSTFHALGVRLLRAEGERVGLKANFSILDADDVLALLKDAGGTTDNALARRWQWAISRWKNDGLGSAAAAEAATSDDERVAARVLARYEERLAAYQAVDFDDLVALPQQLLARDGDVRARWRERFRYVLVDEVQDTNALQYELLKLLAGERGLFTAVGDDDQSIYGWRGATIENLKRLPRDYPALTVIPLEQNYRSTSRILRAANGLIAHNPKLYPKNLWSDLGEGDPVVVVECDGEEHEAQRAVARIESLRDAGAAPGGWAEFAILYRANHQARAFEQALRKANIPYKVSGGQSFFDRAEIRDLCAWLRLIVNDDDDPAFVRAATTPKRGIGHQTLASLGSFASRWKASLFAALHAESLPDVLGARAIGSLHEFGRCVNALQHRARHTRGTEDVKALLMDWLREIGYEAHLHDGEDAEKLAAARWTNVLDFVDWIAKRCGGELEADGSFQVEPRTLLEVAQTISVIVSLAERGDDPDRVTLSTLHAAKGLEWPHVVLAGVNEGLLPFRADDEEMTVERLEEERRLMYVGITRARRTLAVSTLRRRRRGRATAAGVPSRFIAEMKLDDAGPAIDPKAKLKALREAALARSAAAAGPAG